MRFIAASLLVTSTLFGCGPALPPSPPDPSLDAKFVCEKFVRNSLKAPSTAKFPSQREFLALPGKAKDGNDSPASLIASTVSNGLSHPASGAKMLMEQGFLRAVQYLDVERQVRRGQDAAARKIIYGALVEKFSNSDYVVASYVDAQNAFGAMLRSSFICMTSNAGNSQWRPDGIALIN